MTLSIVHQEKLSLDDTAFDGFERRLLPVFRHFMRSLNGAHGNAWHAGYSAAADAWGPAVGLQVAHGFGLVVLSLWRFGKDSITVHDPLDLTRRDLLTRDELHFLDMLHHMRRSSSASARRSIHALTEGRMDAGLIHEAQTFARHNAVNTPRARHQKPRLVLVKR